MTKGMYIQLAPMPRRTSWRTRSSFCPGRAKRSRFVLKEAPDASEAGYAGWRLIGYRSPHYFCFVAPQPDHVRLGFEHSKALPDPDRLLEPMGKQVRFVRLAPGGTIPLRGIQRLIRTARRTLPERRKA